MDHPIRPRSHLHKPRVRVATHVIPPVVDPIGRHWRQPSLDKILIGKAQAFMTEATFAQLGLRRYMPEGKVAYSGRLWRFQEAGVWHLGWMSKGQHFSRVIVLSR